MAGTPEQVPPGIILLAFPCLLVASLSFVIRVEKHTLLPENLPCSPAVHFWGVSSKVGWLGFPS